MISGSRNISLTLRGFEGSSADLARSVGEEPSLRGDRGERRASGAKLRQSFILYEQPMAAGDLWDQAVQKLLTALGGEQHLAAVIAREGVAEAHVSVNVPVRSSEEQEGGYVSSEILRQVVGIGASFGVAMY